MISSEDLAGDDFSPVELAAINRLDLDLDLLRAHRRNVIAALTRTHAHFFPVLDTCRLDNAGVRTLPQSDDSLSRPVRVVAMVPSAGASSRYLGPLTPMIEAIKNKDPSKHESGIRDAVQKLKVAGILGCPLPPPLVRLIAFLNESQGVLPDDDLNLILEAIEAPKALYPAVIEGHSFLDIKLMEHQIVGDFAGEVYVCPPGRTKDFTKAAQGRQHLWPIKFYEQGSNLATLRFDSLGHVVFDDQNILSGLPTTVRSTDLSAVPSTVPAGHGSLLQLFPKIRDDFPGVDGLFIRNIDNISGCSDAVIHHTRQFLFNFKWTLLELHRLRAELKDDHRDDAEQAARRILQFWKVTDISRKESAIITLLAHLFHTDGADLSHQELNAMFARPFIVMGQVPNTGHDLGGSCVFTEISGKRSKLCLELPHATEEDRQQYLSQATKATHFNPVFVAAEIPDRNMVASWSNHPFWLIAKKSWRGQEVYYQESILYEMLGNSLYCNVIFAEVPRLVFNPHKTLLDATHKSLKNWIP